jgi:hypothetical protein
MRPGFQVDGLDSALTESAHVPAATGSTLVFRPITIQRRAPAIAYGHASTDLARQAATHGAGLSG